MTIEELQGILERFDKSFEVGVVLRHMLPTEELLLDLNGYMVDFDNKKMTIMTKKKT